MPRSSPTQVASAEPVPDVPLCRRCRRESTEVPLDLHQPDVGRPDRVIGCCPSCGAVYRVGLVAPRGPGPGRWETIGRPAALPAPAA